MKTFKIGFFLFVLLIVVFLAGFIAVSPTPDANPTGRPVEKQVEEPFGDINQIRVADIDDTRLLELVNLDHPVHDDQYGVMTVPAFGVVPLATADITLRREALDSAKDLFAGARQAGHSGLFVSSGYRDAGKQKTIYDAAEDKSFVQPPGHSEHQIGLAADILVEDVGQQHMAASPEGQWIPPYDFYVRQSVWMAWLKMDPAPALIVFFAAVGLLCVSVWLSGGRPAPRWWRLGSTLFTRTPRPESMWHIRKSRKGHNPYGLILTIVPKQPLGNQDSYRQNLCPQRLRLLTLQLC